MDQKISTVVGTLIIIIMVLTAGAFLFKVQKFDMQNLYVPLVQKPKVKNNDTACTMEAKLCPDGSYVSRTGPNCDFAACPGESGELGLVPNEIEGWMVYRNEKYGYQIQIPVEDKFGGKVEVIEDGDIAFITAKKGYNHEEILNNIKNLKDDYQKTEGITFALLAKKVANDQELDTFIKKAFGEKCSFGKKTESSQPGVYDVMIDTSSWNQDHPEDGCFLNYAFALKYYPEKNTVVSWDYGQAMNFTLPSGEPADKSIGDSFKFVD